MSLGNKLIELRKSKGLSQEEVAEELDVSRQTVSKWETDQTTPDFDKIKPLCDLFDISSDELLNVTKEKIGGKLVDRNKIFGRNLGISIGLYVLSIPILILVQELFHNELLSVVMFFVAIAVATALLIYTCIVYGEKEEKKKKKKDNKIEAQICNIISTTGLIIYFIVSFATMAWHITWIIFLIIGLCNAIVKLIFTYLKGKDKNE